MSTTKPAYQRNLQQLSLPYCLNGTISYKIASQSQEKQFESPSLNQSVNAQHTAIKRGFCILRMLLECKSIKGDGSFYRIKNLHIKVVREYKLVSGSTLEPSIIRIQCASCILPVAFRFPLYSSITAPLSLSKSSFETRTWKLQVIKHRSKNVDDYRTR